MYTMSVLLKVRKMAAKCQCSEHVNRIREGTYMVFGKAVIIRVSVTLISFRISYTHVPQMVKCWTSSLKIMGSNLCLSR